MPANECTCRKKLTALAYHAHRTWAVAERRCRQESTQAITRSVATTSMASRLRLISTTPSGTAAKDTQEVQQLQQVTNTQTRGEAKAFTATVHSDKRPKNQTVAAAGSSQLRSTGHCG